MDDSKMVYSAEWQDRTLTIDSNGKNFVIDIKNRDGIMSMPSLKQTGKFWEGPRKKSAVCKEIRKHFYTDYDLFFGS